MRRNQQKHLKVPRENNTRAVKYDSDYQIEWQTVIPSLRKYELKIISFLTVMGDAPKDFTSDKEYRKGHRTRRDRTERFIAKVGSKFYPNESITEQLITRIGECFQLRIAQSKLRMIDGQVRFMSKYFLSSNSEQLTHGAEIFESCLGKQEYREIADQRIESEYFSFQMACEAVKHAFPQHHVEIIRGLVEMLAFDALIGHNDRHPYNWGVIVPLDRIRSPRFSPIYDTARALFWNKSERYIERVLSDKRPLLEGYVRKCTPPMGWDGETKVDFFGLIGLIWDRFKPYRLNIEKLLTVAPLEKSIECIDKEFRDLMSANRRELIKRCLRMRQRFLCEAVNKVQKGRDKCQLKDLSKLQEIG
jgi:hypothetical protein